MPFPAPLPKVIGLYKDEHRVWLSLRQRRKNGLTAGFVEAEICQTPKSIS
jgi:hypothetical protein